jgi:DNA-binding response OmpR family regulator
MLRKIVMIDPDAKVVRQVRPVLLSDGFDLKAFSAGIAGYKHIEKNATDLVILEAQLPDCLGTDLCRQIRMSPKLTRMPLIFLAAKGEEPDRIVGLEHGADDYISKPFSCWELMARIKAVIRRAERQGGAGDVVDRGVLLLDRRNRTVRVRGNTFPLRGLEFELLQFFLSHPNQLFDRNALCARVWGAHRAVRPRNVDVQVLRLREIIEEQPGKPKLLRTVRNAGYFLALEEPRTEFEPRPYRLAESPRRLQP